MRDSIHDPKRSRSPYSKRQLHLQSTNHASINPFFKTLATQNEMPSHNPLTSSNADHNNKILRRVANDLLITCVQRESLKGTQGIISFVNSLIRGEEDEIGSAHAWSAKHLQKHNRTGQSISDGPGTARECRKNKQMLGLRKLNQSKFKDNRLRFKVEASSKEHGLGRERKDGRECIRDAGYIAWMDYPAVNKATIVILSHPFVSWSKSSPCPQKNRHGIVFSRTKQWIDQCELLLIMYANTGGTNEDLKLDIH
ncbi:hypothetical protein IW261DRAFT_1426541 [Armillaria novae-zelandiae]|uniref:Uncharacterized protein n=1 Tax=Armillaria novae-zelandiae TaxID=153914 RepID=A0AA39NKY9_9AGAR|nr:hypothetical protein IW261DRAFT_1426541 [Armillaria novae-zelandiae]